MKCRFLNTEFTMHDQILYILGIFLKELSCVLDFKQNGVEDVFVLQQNLVDSFKRKNQKKLILRNDKKQAQQTLEIKIHFLLSKLVFFFLFLFFLKGYHSPQKEEVEGSRSWVWGWKRIFSKLQKNKGAEVKGFKGVSEQLKYVALVWSQPHDWFATGAQI